LTKIKDLKHFSRLKKFSNVIDREIKHVEKDFNKNSEKFGNINFYLIKSRYNIKTPLINRLSSNNPNEVYLLGYEFGNELAISARNQANIFNMRELLKDCVSGLEGSNSGGHSAAAGAKIHISQLSDFRECLKKYDLKKARIN